MRRIAVVLSVVEILLLLTAPAVMAAGGGNPPPFEPKVVGPSVNGTILMDPHCQAFNNNVCIQGGQATVNIGNGQSQASFAFLSTFPVAQGCVTDPSLLGNPAQRFLFTPTNQK